MVSKAQEKSSSKSGKQSTKPSSKAMAKSETKKVVKKVSDKKGSDKASKASSKPKSNYKSKPTVDSGDEGNEKGREDEDEVSSMDDDPQEEEAAPQENGKDKAEEKKKVDRPLPPINLNKLAKRDHAVREALTDVQNEDSLPEVLDIPDILLPYFEIDGPEFVISESTTPHQRKRLTKLNKILREVRKGGRDLVHDQYKGTVRRVLVESLKHLNEENGLGLTYTEKVEEVDEDGNKYIRERERSHIRIQKNAIDMMTDDVLYSLMQMIHSAKLHAVAAKRKQLSGSDVEMAVLGNRALNNIINLGKVDRFQKGCRSSGYLVAMKTKQFHEARKARLNNLKEEIKERKDHDISLTKVMKDFDANEKKTKEALKKIKDRIEEIDAGITA